MKEILFVTVEYNNPADTEIFLSSVGRMRDVSACEVVVVDNSDAPSRTTLNAEHFQLDVRRMRPAKNLYYWGGAAFAIDAYHAEAGSWPDWIVVCNNDVEILDADFTRKLRQLDPASHPIIAPSILSKATGKDQNPLLETYPGKLKRMKWRFYDVSYYVAKSLLAIHAAGKSFTASARNGVRQDSQARRVYAPHGACMIFSSRFFDAGGNLDTQVPLFAEELTVAALAEKLGMPVWYQPDLRVSHAEHSTTGHKLTRAKYEMERMARRRFYEYHETADG